VQLQVTMVIWRKINQIFSVDSTVLKTIVIFIVIHSFIHSAI